MNNKKMALTLILAMLISSPLYGCNSDNNDDITEQDKKDTQQQQSTYISPFIYYPNSYFQGYSVNNGNRSYVDFYGWHSWVAPQKNVTSPYTSSSSNVKPSSGGISSPSKNNIGHASGGYSGVHAGSIAG